MLVWRCQLSWYIVWNKKWCGNSCCAYDTMHFCRVPMYLVELIVPWTIYRHLTPLVATQLQTVIFAVKFRHSGLNSSPRNIITYVWPLGLVDKPKEGAFIAEQHLLPHLTTRVEASSCPQDSVAALEVCHQRLPACILAPQTEPATHCWWACNDVAILHHSGQASTNH